MERATVLLRRGADAERVRRSLIEKGLWVTPLGDGAGRLGFAVEPHSRRVPRAELMAIDGIDTVLGPEPEHPLVDGQPPVVEAAGRRIGAGEPFALMAGPCSVESPEQMDAVAARVARAGASFLRGGAFKPRRSPYAFQGHGIEALRWIRESADRHGLAVVTEALSEGSVEAVAAVADLIQVGSRSMHAPALLRAVGSAGKPVLLKRGMAATVDEWLLAGESLLRHGAAAVVFCERGVRGFDASTRNLLDLSAVALLSGVHGLPVVVDPSHAAGRRDLIAPLSRAARAAGAAGLIVETHDDPGGARSDGPQALSARELDDLVADLGLPARAARTPRPAPSSGAAP
jgi:3-deoxy-7-phosphoheptulonate synthase